jgi:hypothetical protein
MARGASSVERTSNLANYRVAIAAGSLVAAIGVFVAPWYVGGMQPVAGESYAFGFHNRTATLGLVTAVGIICLGGLITPPVREQSHRVLDWFQAGDPWKSGLPERIVLLTACVIMAGWILWLDSLLVIPYWGEADYFLCRIDLVAMGYRPYVDFQYNYGPLLLYVPLALDMLSQASLGIENAYAFTVVGLTLLGFCSTFFFLNSLTIPAKYRPWVLGMALAIWLPLSMGLNYVPLRFTYVPFVLAFFDWCVRSQGDSRKNAIVVGLAALSMATGAFLISPEMGVSCCVGLLASCITMAIAGKRTPAIAGAAGVIAAVLVTHSFSEGYFEGLQAFAGGANNFPILPNLHNLLLIAAALFVLGNIGIAVASNRFDPRAPLAASIATSAAVLLAPALGRCDPGHVLVNGLLVFFCVFAAAAANGEVWLRAWLTVFAVAFIVAMQFSYWSHYVGNYRYAFDVKRHYAEHPEQVLAWRQAWEERKHANAGSALPNWKRVAPYPGWADQHNELRGPLGLPLIADIGLDRYAKLAKGFVPAYHPVPKTEILTESAVARAVEDAKRNPYIIIPENLAGASQINQNLNLEAYGRQTSAFLSGLMLYPVNLRACRQPFVPDLEVSKRLMRDCKVIGSGNGIVILAPERDFPDIVP